MVEFAEEGESNRETVLALINRKDNIEREIAQLKEILNLNSISMNEPLVTADGYPRDDIDVYLVRHTRHKIICLQNDHKALMREIEMGLHAVHQQSRGDPEEQNLKPSLTSAPIAKVNFVHAGSPAALSGLQVGDAILEFGSINETNFGSLRDIAAVVEHSVGQKISLTILRGGSHLRVSLTPKPWAGRGLLGCNVLPIAESVDR